MYFICILYVYRHEFIQLALHTPRMKRMTGIRSKNNYDVRINSTCYYNTKNKTPCIIEQNGTNVDLVFDSDTYLLHFKPRLVCKAKGHKNKKEKKRINIKFMFWTTKKNRLYFDSKDEIVNKLIVWTPRTPQQTAERGYFTRKKHFTQRCMIKLLQMVLNC